jgi:hypothetical protein
MGPNMTSVHTYEETVEKTATLSLSVRSATRTGSLDLRQTGVGPKDRIVLYNCRAQTLRELAGVLQKMADWMDQTV